MLLARREMHAPVLLPAGFVRFRTLRPFLAVADRLDAIPRHAEADEEFLGRGGAAVAQAEVVFRRSALVAMTFDHDRRVREIAQDGLDGGGILRQHALRVAADVTLVVIEVSI